MAAEDRPITAWMRVLDEIESSVSRRLALAEEPPAATADAGPPAPTPLQVLDDRLAQMQARLERAEQDARDADAVLHQEAEAHRRWAEQTATARRRLADRAQGV